MKLPQINMPTLAGIRASFSEAKESLSQYSVFLKLPTFSKNVSVEPLTDSSDLAPVVNTTKKIFEGSIVKGLVAAATTALVGIGAVIALGGIAAVLSNPIGIALAAVVTAVASFVLGSSLNVTHTPPPPVVEEVVPEPVPLTTIQYCASLIGLGWTVGVKA